MAKEDEIVLLKSGKVCKKGKNSWSPRQAYIVQPSTLLISKCKLGDPLNISQREAKKVTSYNIQMYFISDSPVESPNRGFALVPKGGEGKRVVFRSTNRDDWVDAIRHASYTWPDYTAASESHLARALSNVNCNEDTPRGSINTGDSSDSNLERVDVALMDNKSQKTEVDPVLNVVDSEGDASKAVNQKVSEETLISAHPQSDDISLSSEDGSQGNRVTFLSWMAVRFTSRRQAGQIPYARLNMSTEDHTRNQSEISCFTRIRLALRLGRQGVQQMRTRLASGINNFRGRPNKNEEPVSDAYRLLCKNDQKI